MRLRTVALVGVMSIAALGLIGSGAHAAFTAQTTSRQTITVGTSGTPDVVLSSRDASFGNGTKALTLKAVQPIGPSFTSGDQVVTIKNKGTFSASAITQTLATADAGSDLATQLSICEVTSGYVLYNGPLPEALDTEAIVGSIAAGGSDTYILNVYAGAERTACGDATTGPAVSGTSTAPGLSLSAPGVSITITTTVGIGYRH
jgi:predicted ribosomally synthesized peptide with SipW-like signal peptide